MESKLRDLAGVGEEEQKGAAKRDDPYKEELEGILRMVDFKHYKGLSSVLGKKRSEKEPRRRSSLLGSSSSSEGSPSNIEDDEASRERGGEKKQGKSMPRSPIYCFFTQL